MLENCVFAILNALGFTQTKVSRHLIYLKHSGLVKDRREGLWVIYSLTKAEHQHQRLLKELKDLLDLYPLLQEDIARLNKAIKNGSCTTYAVIFPQIKKRKKFQ
jgi:ArsR family transcriptional regulator